MALNFHSSALLFNLTPTTKFKHYSSSLSVRCSAPSSSDEDATNKKKKRLSQQSSWETEDSEGNDYLYRLGAEADNMNIAVGAKAGVIDSLFAGNFLGKDCITTSISTLNFILSYHCANSNSFALWLIFQRILSLIIGRR